MAQNQDDAAGLKDDLPRPLDYRPPQASGGLRAAMATIVGGFVAGAAMVVFVGAVMWLAIYPAWPPAQGPPFAPIFFGLVLIAAGAGAYWAIRSSRQGTPRPFLIVLLLGLGVAALAEGICFADSANW